MNGIHDMGGMHCYGPVVQDEDQIPFHSEWERRMFGMFVCCFAAGMFNVDQFRYAMERIEPGHYLESSYYEHWLEAIWTISQETGVLTEAELTQRMAQLATEDQ